PRPKTSASPPSRPRPAARRSSPSPGAGPSTPSSTGEPGFSSPSRPRRPSPPPSTASPPTPTPAGATRWASARTVSGPASSPRSRGSSPVPDATLHPFEAYGLDEPPPRADVRGSPQEVQPVSAY